MASKQLVEHVLVTQSPLQDDIILAMFRQGLVDPVKSLIITLRGPSTLTEETAGCPIVDGDAFGRLRTKRHFYKVLKDNYKYIWRYRSAVVRRLAKEYVVYAAMYSTWFLRDLAEHAASVRVLEDGIGSYREWAPWYQACLDWCPPKGSHHARSFLHQCSYPVRYRYDQIGMTDLIFSADKYYVISPLAFPFANAIRKIILDRVFVADQSGKYDGSIIWATSPLVENKSISMTAYLATLDLVVQKIAARGHLDIYIKLHPRQQIDTFNYEIYKEFLRNNQHGVSIHELSNDTSLERLLMGSQATLLTAISSVMVYAHSFGRPVISYRQLFKPNHNEASLIPPDMEVLFAAMSEPL